MNDHGPGNGMMRMAVRIKRDPQDRQDDAFGEIDGCLAVLGHRHVGVGLPGSELLVTFERAHRVGRVVGEVLDEQAGAVDLPLGTGRYLR